LGLAQYETQQVLEVWYTTTKTLYRILSCGWDAVVHFTVRFYFFADETAERPIVTFLEQLRRDEPILHKLLVAGLKKLESRDRHGPPLTEVVDREHSILELRVGHANIARAFFFFQRGQEIIVTNGYVKKRQRVDAAELQKARL
jgi:hypothetical protein